MKKLLVFTIDDKYVDPFIVAIKSLSMTNNINNFIIGLVYSKISIKNLEKIRVFFKKLKVDIIFKKIEDIFLKFKIGYHFNSVIFYRLLIPDLFPNYKESTYFDSDMLFLQNVEELFEIEMKNYVVCCVSSGDKLDVPDHMKKHTDTYFVSGLMIINHENFIRNNIYEKCIYFLENFEYMMPDQDALNYAIPSELVFWLPNEYGAMTHQIESNNYKISEAKIFQFSGSLKPWHYGNNHPCRKIYLNVWTDTPLYSIRFLILDRTVRNLKYIKRKALKLIRT